MRTAIAVLAFVLCTGLAAAQQPAQPAEKPAKTFISAADVADLIAKAKSERKDGQALVAETLVQLGSYNGHLEYRASVGPAAVHEKEAELFYVLEGSATLVTGGKLVDEKRSSPDNLMGSAIEGGTPRQVSKGDFILVPENTPHWFSPINGAITVFSIHVPRP
jgi:mannose-6-phosphate isomerase-like protein (cupin superfamily)